MADGAKERSDSETGKVPAERGAVLPAAGVPTRVQEPPGRSGREVGDARVLVTRGGLPESVHRVHVTVVNGEGRPVASAGNVSYPTCMRSAAKPFQALPLVEDGVTARYRLTGDQLAVCCASHNAEARHLQTVRSLLGKVGLEEGDLECGPHPPLREEEALRLARGRRPPRPIHNNCSGKHAGMLALAVAHGWPTAGYHAPGHPVQRRMLEEVARWTGLPEDGIGTSVDGCGVLCFTVPLDRMALAFARFAGVAAAGEPAARVIEAMTCHPFMAGGTGRLCTALMERAGDRVFAKVGAEGVYGAGLPARGLGIAVKVEDGGRRAAGVALLEVLAALGVLNGEDLDALGPFHRPVTLNTRSEPVGELRADVRLAGRA